MHGSASGQSIRPGATVGVAWYDIGNYTTGADAALRLTGTATWVGLHARLQPRAQIVWQPEAQTGLIEISGFAHLLMFGSDSAANFGIEVGLGAAHAQRASRPRHTGWFMVLSPGLSMGAPITDRVSFRTRAGIDWFYAEPELFLRNFEWALPHVSAGIELDL